LVSVFVSLDGDEVEPELLLDSDGWLGRLSVTYQPEPLKTIAGRESNFLVSPPQLGQTFIGWSLKLCLRSKRWPQA
jgi:hypothetical protein